jgi:two-component system NtrC family response regulator
MKSLRILVIDDEQVICDACNLILSENGYTVDRCISGKAGLQAIERTVYNIVLLDLKLPDLDGMEILKHIQRETPDLCVIIMTGYDTIPVAVEAMKLGAADYLGKPFTDDELINAVEKACSNS